MRQLRNLMIGALLSLLAFNPVLAQNDTTSVLSGKADSSAVALNGGVSVSDSITPIASLAHKNEPVNVKEIVFGHIGDSYEWHITTWFVA